MCRKPTENQSMTFFSPLRTGFSLPPQNRIIKCPLQYKLLKFEIIQKYTASESHKTSQRLCWWLWSERHHEPSQHKLWQIFCDSSTALYENHNTTGSLKNKWQYDIVFNILQQPSGIYRNFNNPKLYSFSLTRTNFNTTRSIMLNAYVQYT